MRFQIRKNIKQASPSLSHFNELLQSLLCWELQELVHQLFQLTNSSRVASPGDCAVNFPARSLESYLGTHFVGNQLHPLYHHTALLGSVVGIRATIGSSSRRVPCPITYCS